MVKIVLLHGCVTAAITSIWVLKSTGGVAGVAVGVTYIIEPEVLLMKLSHSVML